jgi:hypothetical protein
MPVVSRVKIAMPGSGALRGSFIWRSARRQSVDRMVAGVRQTRENLTKVGVGIETSATAALNEWRKDRAARASSGFAHELPPAVGRIAFSTTLVSSSTRLSREMASSRGRAPGGNLTPLLLHFPYQRSLGRAEGDVEFRLELQFVAREFESQRQMIRRFIKTEFSRVNVIRRPCAVRRHGLFH